MARRKFANIDPQYIKKQRDSLLHNNRKVIRFNREEMAAIDEYCKRLGITSRSAHFRKVIMERVLSALGENHPTLF